MASSVQGGARHAPRCLPVMRFSAGASQRPGVRSHPPDLVDARYVLLNELGHGGSGFVFRVLDRLTGRVVTLKRLHVTSGGGDDARHTLAQEFGLLASLRHPNIIGVLDYGFDGEGEPYLTMDLAESAATIVQAGAGAPLAVQIDLVVQMVRALAYLHDHGIIHRDLKPANVIVVRHEVKVLDFGLSLRESAGGAEEAGWAGTLEYLAPELLYGGPPDARGDLYAAGMIAYEMINGRHPFDTTDRITCGDQIVNLELPRAQDAIDARLRPVFAALLAKDPARRPKHAADVIASLSDALDQPIARETIAIRESVLHTAPLVGREQELASLVGLLDAARDGTGAAALVGGESGVGKSRLLDEVRIRALVAGVVVVRGQGLSRSGGPYHIWRDVLSHLVLRVELDDADAAVLKSVVPNVGALLGRPVSDPPPLEGDAAQARLLLAVERLFRAQPRPVLVLLEDLQWVGSESLRLLQWLATAASTMRLVLLASFRYDEAPNLPSDLRACTLQVLPRLDSAAVVALGESLIGQTARRPRLAELLVRETEGIPFFVVEVIRALAESAGGLARIADVTPPERVMSGGMEKVVRRRLAEVPPAALPPLTSAAVIGRRIDAHLMSVLHPALDVDEWAAQCARAGVLELRDQTWRFAHDKLRERLLLDLTPAAAREHHRNVASTIERLYGEYPEVVTALAYHWREAGEPEHEARCARQAGLLALQNGACREAVEHLSRALTLMRAVAAAPETASTRNGHRRRRAFLDLNAHVDPASADFQLGCIEGALGEAYYRLGDLARCREHSERALRYFGQRVPTGRASWVRGVFGQAALRCAMSVHSVTPRDRARTERVAAEIARVELQLIDSFFYSMRVVPLVWATVRLLNQCEPAGNSRELAQAYALNGLLAGFIPIRVLADTWSHRALEIAESIGDERVVAWVLSRVAVLQLVTCRWTEADRGIMRATDVADAVGDPRVREESQALNGSLCLYTGQFARGLDLFAETQRSSRRSGNRQAERWGLLGQAAILARIGRADEARRLARAALQQIDEEAMKGEAIWGFGALALACLRLGDDAAAYEAADRALGHILTSRAVAYWAQSGTAATAEVLLTLAEAGWQCASAPPPVVHAKSHQAVAGMIRFGRRLKFGRPYALIWRGLELSLAGRRGRALRLWRSAVALADASGMPYERARADLEIGRHPSSNARVRADHLTRALATFEALGCQHDAARARRELMPAEAAA